MIDSNLPTTRRMFLGAATSVAAGLVELPRLVAAADDSERHGWKIGCYTRPWEKYDYRVALDAIADTGFSYVGLMTTKSNNGLIISSASTIDEAHQVSAEVSQRGLTIPSVYAGAFSLNTIQDAIASLRKLVDHCAAVKGESLLLAGTSDLSQHARYYKAIAESADYAAERGVALVLKPHGGTAGNGAQCRQTIEEVDHKNFHLWYDPGNIYFYSDGKLDPVKEAATLDGIVTGMCVKDYSHPKNVMVTPGDGLVDFPALFQRLEQGGFTHGPLLIETLLPGDRPALLKEAKRAHRYIQQAILA